MSGAPGKNTTAEFCNCNIETKYPKNYFSLVVFALGDWIPTSAVDKDASSSLSLARVNHESSSASSRKKAVPIKGTARCLVLV